MRVPIVVKKVNEAHARWQDRTPRDILARTCHDGCGGLAAKAELLTGIEMLASATPKIRKHRLTPPVAPNGVEQGKVYWQS